MPELRASIKERLLQLSRRQREDFNYLLTRYAADRLLYRLSQSPYKHQFILNGATLFRIWSGEPHRATKDVDLLGHGDHEVPHLEQIFQDICYVPFAEDSMTFGPETVKCDKIHLQFISISIFWDGNAISTANPHSQST